MPGDGDTPAGQVKVVQGEIADRGPPGVADEFAHPGRLPQAVGRGTALVAVDVGQAGLLGGLLFSAKPPPITCAGSWSPGPRRQGVSRACGPLSPRCRPASPRKCPQRNGSRAAPALPGRSRQDDHQTGAAPRMRGKSSRPGRSRCLAVGWGCLGRRTAAEYQSESGPAHPRSGEFVLGWCLGRRAEQIRDISPPAS
jgi:hypothetical protein